MFSRKGFRIVAVVVTAFVTGCLMTEGSVPDLTKVLPPDTKNVQNLRSDIHVDLYFSEFPPAAFAQYDLV